MRTFGEAVLQDGTWTIRCEPHVLLRLKRVMGKTNRQASTLKLSNTPENCRELEWFADRYPLTFSHPDVLTSKATSFREKVKRLDSIIGADYTPRDFELAIPAREYQRVAAELLLEQGYLLLGDDLGIGKTVSAIAAMTDKRMLPAVVVTVAGSMPLQWRDEIRRFAPGLTVHVLKKGQPYELPKFFGRGPDVIVLNYHKLPGWAEVLAEYANSLIFDEIQELRRNASLKYESAQRVRANVNYCLGLSATPIYNFGAEFHNIMEIVAPGALATCEEFGQEWCSGGWHDKARLKDPIAFGTYLREAHLMLRRTRAEVGRELPEVTRIHHTIGSDVRKLDEVKGAAGELARLILSGNQEFKGQKMQAGGELSYLLRQATGIAKAPFVAEFVRMLAETGEKVMLVGWHREVYSIWEEKLRDLNPVYFTGTESPKQKHESIQKFKDGSSRIFMMSLRAGAGIDGLQYACRTMVFGELDWSPGVHEQCIGRIHRDGQTDPVAAYFLVSDHGSDPVIADVLGVKKEQIEGVKNPKRDLIERLETDGNRIRSLAERYLEQISGKKKMR